MKTRHQHSLSKTTNNRSQESKQCHDVPHMKKLNSITIPSRHLKDRKPTGCSTSIKSRNPQVTTSVTEKVKFDKIFNVLIGVTGSVATVKLVDLVHKIKSLFPRPYVSKVGAKAVEASVAIRIVMTTNSKHFAPKDELINTLNDSNIEIYDDADEWSSWKKMGDPVLHIELRKWADLCVIAPLDANTMAKLACGLCDNLLTCTIRAWDISKPLVYCPAMNVHMYNHPMTREHICKLDSYGYLRVDSVEKRLACGDYGMGAMASVDSISDKVLECLLRPRAKEVPMPNILLRQLPTYPILTAPDKPAPKIRISSDSEYRFDIDPSKLLEQTMITDEAIVDYNAIDTPSCEQILSINRPESLAKIGEMTPVFDTSKFLALCHNNDKGCFTCVICKHDYKNRKSMSRHLKEQHVQGNIFHCRPCGVSYKRREKLIKHNRDRHPEIFGV